MLASAQIAVCMASDQLLHVERVMDRPRGL